MAINGAITITNSSICLDDSEKESRPSAWVMPSDRPHVVCRGNITLLVEELVDQD
ncbi:hypothetical protein VTH82DRAFT_954 [Thermothelomyces myriococcoides]